MKKYLSIIITAALICPSFARAESRAINMSDHTPGNAAIRSTLIPGWGQSFNGQQAKSYVVAGGVLASGIAAFYFFNKAGDTYEDYERRGIKNDALYNDYESQSDQASLYTGIAAGFWAYGIIDAYFSGKKKYDGGQAGTRRKGFDCRYNGEKLVFLYSTGF